MLCLQDGLQVESSLVSRLLNVRSRDKVQITWESIREFIKVLRSMWPSIHFHGFRRFSFFRASNEIPHSHTTNGTINILIISFILGHNVREVGGCFVSHQTQLPSTTVAYNNNNNEFSIPTLNFDYIMWSLTWFASLAFVFFLGREKK